MLDRFNQNYKRPLLFLVLALTLVVFFQNCAGAKCPSGTSNASSSNESLNCDVKSSTSNSPSGSGTSGSGSSSSGSGSGSYGSISNGSGGGGVYSGGSGGGGSLGGGSGSSGSSGGSSGSGSFGGSTSNVAFRIFEQPQGASVPENREFSLRVITEGGKFPYTYQWYRNDTKVTRVPSTNSELRDQADNYNAVEGVYHVEVTDAAGATLKSERVRVVITEVEGPCATGIYFTFSNANFDSYGYIPNYLDGPRGKFLLHSSFDRYNTIFGGGRFAGLQQFRIDTSLKYLDKVDIACSNPIHRINSPMGGGYGLVSGVVTFECRNSRLKFVSNTCQWTDYSQ